VEEKMINPEDMDLVQVIDEPGASGRGHLQTTTKPVGFGRLPNEHELLLNL
jgi:hypothetical protein